MKWGFGFVLLILTYIVFFIIVMLTYWYHHTDSVNRDDAPNLYGMFKFATPQTDDVDFRRHNI